MPINQYPYTSYETDSNQEDANSCASKMKLHISQHIALGSKQFLL